MNASIESGKRPKPNGEPGWIITYDPEQKSFKAALIAITFSGIYLEALLHLLIVEKHGIELYKKIDRKSYEDKLELLRCTPLIKEECKYYRDMRRDIVHEKAHFDAGKIYWAQEDAVRAFNFINSVNAYFKIHIS